MPFIVDIEKFRLYIARYVVRGEPRILFLHGYSFNGDIWEQTNVFSMLYEAGKTFISPDMPYGKKSRSIPHSNDEKRILSLTSAIVDRYLKRNIVIVGASLGGYYALRYAIKNPDKVSGLLLLAPARTEGISDPEIKILKDRVVSIIMWGTRDKIVKRSSMERLSLLMNAKLVEVENTSHACYLDRPDIFKRELEVLIKGLEPQ